MFVPILPLSFFFFERILRHPHRLLGKLQFSPLRDSLDSWHGYASRLSSFLVILSSAICLFPSPPSPSFLGVSFRLSWNVLFQLDSFYTVPRLLFSRVFHTFPSASRVVPSLLRRSDFSSSHAPPCRLLFPRTRCSASKEHIRLSSALPGCYAVVCTFLLLLVCY